MTNPGWTTHYFHDKGEQLSGVEYDRSVREQDAAFVRALALAAERGEFPTQAESQAA